MESSVCMDVDILSYYFVKKKKKVMVLYFPKDNVSKGSMKCLYIIRDPSCPALAVLSLTYTVCQEVTSLDWGSASSPVWAWPRRTSCLHPSTNQRGRRPCWLRDRSVSGPLWPSATVVAAGDSLPSVSWIKTNPPGFYDSVRGRTVPKHEPRQLSGGSEQRRRMYADLQTTSAPPGCCFS